LEVDDALKVDNLTKSKVLKTTCWANPKIDKELKNGGKGKENGKLSESIDPAEKDKEETSCSQDTKDVLQEVAREKRERKATKADGAEVPEYLWEEHLLKDSPTPCVLEERTRLRKAMNLMRRRMLAWWKGRVHLERLSCVIWYQNTGNSVPIFGEFSTFCHSCL
jgi:hypothetical protein